MAKKSTITKLEDKEIPKVKKSFITEKNTAYLIGGLYFIIMTIVSFAYHKIGDYGVESDFYAGYIPQAQKILDGIWIIDKYKGPIYPLILGLFSLIFNNYFTAGLFIAIASASATLLFTHKLLHKIFSFNIATIVTLILSVNTTYNLYTYSAGTDMIFMLMAIVILYLLLSISEAKLYRLIIAGAISGLAYLTRYNGIFIVITSISALLLINIYKESWGRRLVHSAIYLAFFALIISPWGMYTHKEKGKAFYNQNYQNVGYEFIAKNNDIGWDEYWYKGYREKYSSMSDVIKDDPKSFFKQFFNNGFDHLFKDLGSLMGWHIGIFSILGLLLLFYHPPTRQQWVFYLANLLFFGVLLLVFYSERFSMFMIPFYATFAVSFLFSENKLLKTSIVKSKTFFFGLAGILILWTFIKSYQYNSENINSGDENLLKIAKKFKMVEPGDHTGDKIMSRKGHIAYYLGLERKYVPAEKNYYDLVAKLWKMGIDYAYIDQTTGGSQYLADPSKIEQDFKPLASAQSRTKVLQREDPEKPYKFTVKKSTSSALLYKVKIDSLKQSIIDAGNWFLENNPDSLNKDIKIMSVAPYFTYYIGAEHVEIPKGGFEQLYQTAISQGVDYIFFGPYEASTRMALGNLIIPGNQPQWLEIEKEINTTGRYPVIIYKVLKN